MSKHKILKYNERPTNFTGPLKYKPILLSDSKGNYLREFSSIIEETGYSIEFQCRGGLRLLDQFFWLRHNLYKKVNKYGHVVVFVWLGTCDLTVKKSEQLINEHGIRIKRNFIDLRHNSEAEAVGYFRDQIVKYVNFVSQFPTVKIVFLDIPFYSIQEYNKYLGNRNCDAFKSSDLELTNRITLCNECIKLVNESMGVVSPKFKNDLLNFRKGKQEARSSLSFSLYKDGLHPNKELAYCWMKKIVSLVFIYCK